MSKPPTDSLLLPQVKLRPSGCIVLRSAYEKGKLDEYSYTYDIVLGKTSMHRLAFYRAYGWLPKGYDEVVRHGCDRKACFNFRHLMAGTQQINVVEDSKISIVARNAAKTHCIHGHEFTPENTRFYENAKGKRRICRACNAAQLRKRRR